MERRNNRVIGWTSAALALAMAAITWYRTPAAAGSGPFSAEIEFITSASGEYDLFLDDGGGFTGDLVSRVPVRGAPGPQHVQFSWSYYMGTVRGLRLDLGDDVTDVVLVAVDLHGSGGALKWRGSDLLDRFTAAHNVKAELDASGNLLLHCIGSDPFITTGTASSRVLQRLTTAYSVPIRSTLAILAAVAAFLLCRFLLRNASMLRHRAAAAINRPTIVLLVIDAVVLIVAFGIGQRIRARAEGFQLQLQVMASHDDLFQVFYAQRAGEYGPGRCVPFQLKESTAPQWMSFTFPQDTLPRYLRFDPGSAQDSLVIYSADIVSGDARERVGLQAFKNAVARKHDVDTIYFANGGLTLKFKGNDPYLSIEHDLRDHMVSVLQHDKPVLLPLLLALGAIVLVHSGLRRSTGFVNATSAASNRDLSLVCAFLLLLDLPLLSVLHPGLLPGQVFDEKRKLAGMPPLELRNLGEFPSHYEAWYRDHFGFREQLYRWNSWTYVFVLRTSPLPDRVIMGKDGWFFQINADVDGDYRGLPLFTFEQLEKIRLKYEARQRWLASLGIRYYIITPPLSGNLNREHLPDRFHRVSDLTWLDLVKAHFDKYSTVPIIDVREPLLRAKEERDVYFKTDIHWNPYGAYFGYQELLRRIARDVPSVGQPWPIEDLSFRIDTNDHGDLAQMLGLNDVLTRVEPIITPLRPRKAAFSHFPDLPGSYYFFDKPQTYVQADTTLPRLLMFHDSFGLYLKPLLSEHFSHSTYIWAGLFIPDAIVADKPDVVVQEFMEMFTVNMPKDTIALTWSR